MKFDDHFQLVLTLVAIASGFYRLVKIESDLAFIRRDLSRALEKLDS